MASGPRPLKYFSAWELHPDFGQVVHKAWRIKIRGSPMFILAKKLQHLKIVLKDWNKEGTGTPSSFTPPLSPDYPKTPFARWLLADGLSSGEPKFIKEFFVEYYRKLLNTNITHPISEMNNLIQLSGLEGEALCAPVSESKLKQALFSMKPHGSPGPDGFSAHFFQNFWSDVKQDFIDAILSFFEWGHLLKQFNHTFISLIPKVKHAESFDNFRPISLCNVVYKTITKIMAERLQQVLPRLISHNQSAFVRGRNIVHSSILAHELTRAMNYLSVRGRTCIKIDLRKAFDSAQWEFLEKVMRGMNFPNYWIHLVLQCVGTASFQS
ncbi:hypothetical protein QJS04_geneDACA016794 [Acorus gramineus]|uniref:Reverse transcriptase domain-containing protein n=1 Tax=Acorus gramineus TaxID=55184 RepID=A0AAV9BH43_ACOGR|nr:hypothetical protein QJS04_geneDACA016794 [Acorus gramineus]